MQDVNEPTFNIPWGYFVGTFDEALKYKYDDLHLKQRELVCSILKMPKLYAHDNVEWYNQVVPKMKDELAPKLKQGIQAFVFQDHSFWYDPFNSQHYLGRDIWGPYVMHYNKVVPLKKVYREHHQVGVDVQIVHDDVYMDIITDHPEQGFHDMFTKHQIQLFKTKKATNHRYLVVDGLTMIGLLQGEIEHYNRSYAFLINPSCGLPPKFPKCAYCTFLAHDYPVNQLCCAFQTLHARKNWKPFEISQRDEMMRSWNKRHEEYCKNTPPEGWITIQTQRPAGGQSGNVSDGSDLIISAKEIIKLLVMIPIPKCECVPYKFPAWYGKNLLIEFAKKWYEQIGGKIVKIHAAKITFPAQMDYNKGVFMFPVAIRCDILNLPLPGMFLFLDHL